MSDINKYNDNEQQRSFVTYASNTIQCLASVITRVSNGANMDLILSDMEDAEYHYDKLKQMIRNRNHINKPEDK